MTYLPVAAVGMPSERIIIHLRSKADIDTITSPLRFVVGEGEDASYVVISDTIVYEYPYRDESDEDVQLFGKATLTRARKLARDFLDAHPGVPRARDFEIEEYLLDRGEDFDERLHKLVERMVNAEIADRPPEPPEERFDLQHEKDYMDVLTRAAGAITKLPEYQRAAGEMAKTMVIKRYITEHDVPVRNRNAPNEIKALIQAYD